MEYAMLGLAAFLWFGACIIVLRLFSETDEAGE